MAPKTITPAEANKMLEEGANLVDIRGADEHAREKIPGCHNIPLDQLSPGCLPEGVMIFHCKSGMRTKGNAEALAQAVQAGQECYILEGGIEGWRKAGHAIEADKSKPLEIIRQVQIAAGSLILLGVVLGFTLSPAFFGLSGFVGAGLMMAGITGWCGLATVLGMMPWNRQLSA